MKANWNLNKSIGCLAMMLALAAAAGFAEQALIDVVHLKDGTILRGLIVEQTVGESLKLATLDRLVYTLADYEVDRVDKQKVREPVPFTFSEVVLLKDGVMFRGTIVEQRPEHSVTLQTQNDVLLTFATADIWKILKEKRLAELPEEVQEERGRPEREGLKIALQIQLARDQVREREREAGKAAAGEAGALQDQIDDLKEGMQQLEQQEQQLEDQAVSERRSQERDRLQGLQQEADQFLADLPRLLEQCGAAAASEKSTGLFPPGLPGWLLPVGFAVPEPGAWQPYPAPDFAAAGFQRQPVAQTFSPEELADQLSDSLAGVVQSSMKRIPSEEDIEARAVRQQAYSGLVGMLGHRSWKRPGNYRSMKRLADAVPVENRVFLYDTHRREGAALSAGLNLIPVFSIGSLVQGDLLGLFLGAAQFVAGVSALGLAQSTGYDGDFWAMAGGAAGAYVLGVLEPFSFQNGWNRRLQERLQLDEATIREVKRQQARAAVLGPPAVRILPAEEGSVAVQLDLVSLSY